MFPAVALLFATAAAHPGLAASFDVPGLAAEVFAVTRRDHGTRVEFRIINESGSEVDASRLFAGGRDGDRGTVARVQAFAEPGHQAVPIGRDALGRCRCSHRVAAILPRWHIDFEADFVPVPSGARGLTIEIPHFPPIERVPITRR